MMTPMMSYKADKREKARRDIQISYATQTTDEGKMRQGRAVHDLGEMTIERERKLKGIWLGLSPSTVT